MLRTHGNLCVYSGRLYEELNNFILLISRDKSIPLEDYGKEFTRAMINARYLFGKSAFMIPTSESVQKRYLVNQGLFVSWSLVLSDYDEDEIKGRYKPGKMEAIVEKAIEEGRDFAKAITFSPYNRSNLLKAYEVAQNLMN